MEHCFPLQYDIIRQKGTSENLHPRTHVLDEVYFNCLLTRDIGEIALVSYGASRPS